MAVLYLVEQGSTLKKEAGNFVIQKESTILQKVSSDLVEQIVIFGNVHLTTPVINHVLKEGIDCVFCSSYGKYHGRLISNESRFGALRKRQLEFCDNPSTNLAIAVQMVRGKLTNQRTLIMRQNRKKPSGAMVTSIDGLKEAIESLESVDRVDRLMGIEGYGSALYFAAFKNMLKNTLGFETRRRRPPPDPVNSMLSFGYTLLGYNTQSAISTVGLDPYIGFLHTPDRSRPSLVLDLIEEFRPIIVDSLVLWLVNTGVLGQDDFKQGDDLKRPVLMREDARKKFIRYYEERVQSSVSHPDGGRTSYRRCFELQARRLARVLTGQAKLYQPFLVK